MGAEEKKSKESELEDDSNDINETEEVIDDELINDPDEKDNTVSAIVYDIASYGVDYDVEGLVKRLKRRDIIIPPFQRDYVWNMIEASRLVESLLLGLPIPGIFLAKDSETNKLLVIDGQQRLKSLQFFYEGFFNPKEASKNKRVFRLKKVQKKFENLGYDTLEENDRRNLDDSIIHATIIKQESPNNDNTSIYHVFERLNTGGRKLAPQEIRVAIYMGKLNDLIVELNEHPSWRELFGKKNSRLKDQELILRFFAVFFNKENYEKPIKEFLNKFNQKYRNPSNENLEKFRNIFKNTTDYILDNGGRAIFRPERVFNTSVFESIMVGVAKIMENNPADLGKLNLEKTTNELFEDKDYVDSTSRATSDQSIFEKRHKLVLEKFNEVIKLWIIQN